MKVSDTSKMQAHEFAVANDLSEEIELKLAELLEETWQDGCRAEETMAMLERLPDAPVKNAY